MSQLQIAWLELASVGGIGVLLALSGVIGHIVLKRQNRRCVRQTEGSVVRYGFPGDGRMYPVIEYFADGTCYKTRKKFRGIKTKRISGFPIPAAPEAYEDEKGWLHVKTGPVSDLHKLAQQLWPVGSKMTVYYDPDNPKRCYADRPVSGGFTAAMFFIMGISVAVLGVFVFFLIGRQGL